MPKINQEEYKVLKDLGDSWKWIARDEDGVLGVYDAKVVKTKFHNFWVMAIKKKIDLTLFNFIQWEDEEPHNITELVKEYESEEAEVKNIEWLKKEIEEDIKSWGGGNPDYFRGASDAYENMKGWLNQLDEPEVLSQKWISENVEYAYFDMLDGSERLSSATAIIRPKKLQNLLVPKQDKPVIPKFVADFIEEVKSDNSLRVAFEYIAQRKRDNHDDELAFWVEEGNSETFARAWLDGYEVADEPHYYVAFEGEFNLLYVTHVDIYGENGKVNYNSESDKNRAMKFTDKSRAKYLANFLDAIVVEVAE